MVCCILILASMFGVFSIPASAAGPSIAYRAHVASNGWQGYVYDGNTAGTVGQGLQMEKLELRLGGVGGGITVNSHVQNIGWTGEQSGGGSGSSVSTGTEGQGLRMEAITLKLNGGAENLYSIVYRVHCQNYGWMDWKRDGEVAGTVGESLRIEAIQIRIENRAARPYVCYHSHLVNVGPQNVIASDGEVAGTVGQGIALEALEVAIGRIDGSAVNGNIAGTAHVQNIGWMATQSGTWICPGTFGQGLRMEAIRLWLEGSIANEYSIEYRAHVQNIGWQDWVRDGAVAGTEGQSLRIEAIQIRFAAKSTNNSNGNNNSGNSNSGNAVTARLDQIANGSLKYNNSTEMRVGHKFSGTRSNEECKGYAKNVFYLCFGITPGSTQSNDYQLSSTSGMTYLGSKTGLNSGSAGLVQSLFANARPGDFVQMKRQPKPTGTNKPHSAIVYAVSVNGVTFLEANTDTNKGIFMNPYSWSELAEKNQAMSVYTATSYTLR